MYCKLPSSLLLTAVIALLAMSHSIAQDKQPAPTKATPATTDEKSPEKETEEPTNIDELALSQSRLADKYSRLEELIFKMLLQLL